ncbi:hypothetical protein [Morganella sp. EGD-HP17]|uniref:hypothetical protein n=1 Tax=Morganella sp. EGD-HP17 TaxID=1435146 RepID=UPI0004046895|nr:hypothetical protein [Morganella sp. EGD-HP17]ETO41455.1 hypothetical protein X965_07945 [Morganella sp. EGD-HP17]
MAHEIDLETAERKVSQLNTLLYVIKDADFIALDCQQVSDLFELASSLADPIACWLIEENEQRKEL